MAIKFSRRTPTVDTWWLTAWTPSYELGLCIDGERACIARLRNGKRICIVRYTTPEEIPDFVTIGGIGYKAVSYPENLRSAKVAFELMAVKKE